VRVAYKVNFEASLSLLDHEVMRLELSGKTIDISRSGMLIRVQQEVLPGALCDVRFVDSKGMIKPERITARVRRSAQVNGDFHLAMEFHPPLEKLDV